MFSGLLMWIEDIRLKYQFGVQRGGLLIVWPWWYCKNQWKPCWSLDFGKACWPWWHHQMWKSYDQLVSTKRNDDAPAPTEEV